MVLSPWRSLGPPCRSNGLQPIEFGARPRPTPSLYFLTTVLDVPFTDLLLEAHCWCGVALALVLLTSAVNSTLLPLTLWLMYLSYVNLGTITANYGWEWLTLETGFLAIFLCPLCSRTPFPRCLCHLSSPCPSVATSPS
eukprot:gene27435-biopygen28432